VCAASVPAAEVLDAVGGVGGRAWRRAPKAAAASVPRDAHGGASRHSAARRAPARSRVRRGEGGGRGGGRGERFPRPEKAGTGTGATGRGFASRRGGVRWVHNRTPKHPKGGGLWWRLNRPLAASPVERLSRQRSTRLRGMVAVKYTRAWNCVLGGTAGARPTAARRGAMGATHRDEAQARQRGPCPGRAPPGMRPWERSGHLVCRTAVRCALFELFTDGGGAESVGAGPLSRLCFFGYQCVPVSPVLSTPLRRTPSAGLGTPPQGHSSRGSVFAGKATSKHTRDAHTCGAPCEDCQPLVDRTGCLFRPRCNRNSYPRS